MRSRRVRAPEAAAAEQDAAPAPEDGYQRLSVNAVLADLPSLDTDQLLLVKSLEEAGDARAVILDRIEDLLVVQEATHHVRQAAPAPAPPAAPPVAGPLPKAPRPPRHHAPRPRIPAKKLVSSELVDQMGGLLAKDAARRSPTARVPVPAPLPSAPPVGPPASGLIMPKRRRLSHGASHHGRAAKILVVVVLVALLAAVAGIFWKQNHKATTPPSQASATLANLIVGNVAGSFTISRVSGPDVPSLGSTDGFVRGYHRDWSATVGHETVSVDLGQYQDVAAASAAATARVGLVNRALTVTHNPGGIAGATGLTGTGAATDAYVIFPKGTYQVTVTVHGPQASVAAEADSVAQAENLLLPQ